MKGSKYIATGLSTSASLEPSVYPEQDFHWHLWYWDYKKCPPCGQPIPKVQVVPTTAVITVPDSQAQISSVHVSGHWAYPRTTTNRSLPAAPLVTPTASAPAQPPVISASTPATLPSSRRSVAPYLATGPPPDLWYHSYLRCSFQL